MPRLVVRGYGTRRTTAGGPVAPTVVGFRDWDVLEDIRGRLIALGLFDGVHLTEPTEDWGKSPNEARSAFVQPVKFEDVDAWDDAFGVSIPRHVTFTVIIAVRSQDPTIRGRTIDQLANLTQNTLDGQSLAGITFPAHTKVRRGVWHKSEPPARELILYGEFIYEVIGFGGHAVTD